VTTGDGDWTSSKATTSRTGGGDSPTSDVARSATSETLGAVGEFDSGSAVTTGDGGWTSSKATGPLCELDSAITSRTGDGDSPTSDVARSATSETLGAVGEFDSGSAVTTGDGDWTSSRATGPLCELDSAITSRTGDGDSPTSDAAGAVCNSHFGAALRTGEAPSRSRDAPMMVCKPESGIGRSAGAVASPRSGAAAAGAPARCSFSCSDPTNRCQEGRRTKVSPRRAIRPSKRSSSGRSSRNASRKFAGKRSSLSTSTNCASKFRMPGASRDAARCSLNASKMIRKRAPDSLFHAPKLFAMDAAGSAVRRRRAGNAPRIRASSAASGASFHSSKKIATSGARSAAVWICRRSGNGSSFGDSGATVKSRSLARRRSRGKTPFFSNAVLPAPASPYSTVRRDWRNSSARNDASVSRGYQLTAISENTAVDT